MYGVEIHVNVVEICYDFKNTVNINTLHLLGLTHAVHLLTF